MNNIYQNIEKASEQGLPLLSILIDPDKIFLPDLNLMAQRINNSPATHVLVGGSTVEPLKSDLVVERLKNIVDLPVVLFPGDINQISDKADGLLFLNLISGRNPDYLISKQVEAAKILKRMNLEIISTSYILIGEENNSTVERVTGTKPLRMNDVEAIVNTAIAGEMIGHKLIYLEAGSGARNSVCYNIIKSVKNAVKIPVIVGGGFNNYSSIKGAYNNGADMVVVGTAFENNLEFFSQHLIHFENKQN